MIRRVAHGAGFDERAVRAFRPDPGRPADLDRWPATGPGARLLELGEWGMRAVGWDELDIVGHWRRFLREPDSYFRHWLDG